MESAERPCLGVWVSPARPAVIPEESRRPVPRKRSVPSLWKKKKKGKAEPHKRASAVHSSEGRGRARDRLEPHPYGPSSLFIFRGGEDPWRAGLSLRRS